MPDDGASQARATPVTANGVAAAQETKRQRVRVLVRALGMKLMAKYIAGDKSGIPGNGIIIVPGKVIDKSNVDDFIGQMKQMLRK